MMLFLTYPRCSLDKHVVLTMLRCLCSPFVVESYVVATELHEDGTPHIHCYLSLSGKVDKRSANCFDLVDSGGERYHGNYQSARDALMLSHIVEREEIMSKEVSTPWYEDLLGQLWSVMGYADHRFAPVPRVFESPYLAGSFVVPQVLVVWIQVNIVSRPGRPMSLVLIGHSRTGKSSWARSLGPHIYMQKRINWDKWNDEASYVFLDDVPRDELVRYNNWKVLMGAQEEYEVRQSYGRVKTINGGIPCIFCLNENVLLDNWDSYNMVRVDIVFKNNILNQVKMPSSMIKRVEDIYGNQLIDLVVWETHKFGEVIATEVDKMPLDEYSGLMKFRRMMFSIRYVAFYPFFTRLKM
ncbi:rep protein [Rhizophagus clarus]|uniref:Rep protein n=1 Tax=Rhizophagus clarus TaxID=94130 RepID=A0A8H3L061_9GLOM|nr:rep protein [Rhizophagus clarus]